MRLGNPLYTIYNRVLEQNLRRGPLPRHVGVILDGNRRFARKMGYDDVSEGHRAGFRKIDELLEWCLEMEIPVVTLWLLSDNNFRRTQAEVSNLLSIIEAKIVQLTYAPSTYTRKYRIRVLGRLDHLPASTRVAIREAEERTRDHDGPMVNLAVDYGGREEIVDAIHRLIQHRTREGDALPAIVSALTADNIGSHLYTADLPDPDLIIRTSGEVRLSGFLLWQSAHSEFYFCDANWPEFRKVDFLRALRSYQQRQRRFGADGPDPLADAASFEGQETEMSEWVGGLRLHSATLRLQSTTSPEFIDITDRVDTVVRNSGIWTGEVHLYTPHTSAGLTINENEPLLMEDMSRFLERLAPAGGDYGHNDFTVRTVNMNEDESKDGHSHCQRLVFNTSECVPVREGRAQLGRWQRVFLVELDSARPREVLVQVLGE
ncbi:MAG: polyprenyl diphosphate synthase [Dehalococcoidia bacterium]